MLKRMLRYVLLIVLIGLAFVLVIEINSQSPSQVLKDLIVNNSLNNPALNLKLNYLVIIPVGEAKLVNLGEERFRGADLIHIRAEAKTFDYIASIFHSKATVDSYIDPKNLDSLYFLQDMEMINKPRENKEIRYDQKKHIMTYVGPRGVEERVIDEHAQDPLSAIFYVESKKFWIGEEFRLSLNTNQKNYIIIGKFVSIESIQISGKNYEVMLVEARVGRKDKNPRHQAKLKIWFLDYQGKRIPILIKAMTNIGPIVARAR